MTFPKQRLEAFTDGVVAIIITIMVMSIPLPETFKLDNIWEFLRSIFIYLLSFIVVGAFWRHHHRIFLYINNAGNNLISSNFLFLFFLSLIPIFTKWVIEQPGALMPVIGYDVVFILVYMCYNFIFHYVAKTSEHEEIQRIKKLREEQHRTPPPRQSWIPFLIASFVIVALITGFIFLAISHTRFATMVLLGIPVASSLLNLFFEDFKPKRNGKRKKLHASINTYESND